ncbi:MAG TPA: tyrosine-type recombinase/integrase [Bryobacteraceae bacterium]|jgi:integrase
MARVNILKQIKSGERWNLVAIPRNKKGGYDWESLPDGRYFVEWYERGKRKREAGGGTAAEALEVARRRKHAIEGRALGLIKDPDEEEAKKSTVHVAVKRYLESVEALKKPNTLRKYKAVLDRFVEFLPANIDPRKVTRDDLTDFMVRLKNKHKLENNTVIHQMIIVAQFLKRHGKGGVTKNLGLPERVISLPREYGDADLKKFFAACTPAERVLFSTFLFTGFREQETVNLFWADINFTLTTIRVTAKPDLGFWPKRWEEREVPTPKALLDLLRDHLRRENCRFVFPSPAGNREWNMLLRCKAIAKRAGLDETKFDLKTFRSTYATRMLRAGFDVRTVQHWMGHRSLETTMRYLAPQQDVHDRLDQVQIAGVL